MPTEDTFQVSVLLLQGDMVMWLILVVPAMVAAWKV
jgi:hypothetical protein